MAPGVLTSTWACGRFVRQIRSLTLAGLVCSEASYTRRGRHVQMALGVCRSLDALAVRECAVGEPVFISTAADAILDNPAWPVFAERAARAAATEHCHRAPTASAFGKHCACSRTSHDGPSG